MKSTTQVLPTPSGDEFKIRYWKDDSDNCAPFRSYFPVLAPLYSSPYSTG